MAYFIDRDMYFTFTENTKRNNIVNRLTLQVSQIPDSDEEVVLATTKNNKYSTSYKYNPDVISLPVATDIQEIIPLSVSYQSNTEEISTFTSVIYRVKALKVNTYKRSYFPMHFNVIPEKVEVSERWYGRNSEYKITDINNTTDEDYDVLFTGVCDIDSNKKFSFGPEISQYNFMRKKYYESEVFSNIPFLDVYTLGMVVALNRTYIADFYTNFYVEIVGLKKNISYGDEIKQASTSQRIVFNKTVQDNSLIQNKTKFNGTPIADYIADTVFKNYAQGRPVATLEWLGSPEVGYGTELKIEPRREYNEEDLITYVVMGKKITYNGGYRETLYLTKKEED